MLIYKAEASLRDEILNKRSFSYASAVDPVIAIPKRALAFNTKTPDTDDLFYTRSILVSTVWNKNDDVFDPIETWAARNTPVDKPTNLEHDWNRLVGHITSNWAISSEGELIPDDIMAEDLPPLFHICNGAVIYLNWQEPEMQQQVGKLLEDIKAGRKFVSMECYFRNFDYAARAGDEYHVIARNEDTAFLTQHLRVYGGSGTFEGYQLGRVLKNITFSGKGYVDKPANPDSIIFTKDDANKFSFGKILESPDFLKKFGVYIKCKANSEEIIMPENNELEQMKAELDAANEKVAVLEANLLEVRDQFKASEDVKVELETKLSEANLQNKEVMKQLDEVRAAQARQSRVSILTDAGVTREDAEAKVDEFAELSDELFSKFAELYIEAKKKSKKEDTTCDELVADEEVDETDAETSSVEVDDDEEHVEANVDGTDDEGEALRTAIASKFTKKLVKERK